MPRSPLAIVLLLLLLPPVALNLAGLVLELPGLRIAGAYLAVPFFAAAAAAFAAHFFAMRRRRSDSGKRARIETLLGVLNEEGASTLVARMKNGTVLKIAPAGAGYTTERDGVPVRLERSQIVEELVANSAQLELRKR